MLSWQSFFGEIALCLAMIGKPDRMGDCFVPRKDCYDIFKFFS